MKWVFFFGMNPVSFCNSKKIPKKKKNPKVKKFTIWLVDRSVPLVKQEGLYLIIIKG